MPGGDGGESWLHLGLFQRDVVLLGAGSLLADELEVEVGSFARGHGGVQLDGLIVVELGLQRTLEDDMAREGAADFDINGLAAVVSDSFREDIVVIPADKRSVFFLESAVNADLAKFARAVDLQ